MSKPSQAPTTSSKLGKEEEKPATVFLFAAEKIVVNGTSMMRLFSVKNKNFYHVKTELLENKDIGLGDFCYGHFSKSGGNDSFKKFEIKVPSFQYTNNTLPNFSKACIKLAGKIIAADSFTVFENKFSNALYTGKSPIAGAEESLCIEIMSPEEIKGNNNKYFFKTIENDPLNLEEKMSNLKVEKTGEKQTRRSSIKQETASSPAPNTSQKTAECTAIVLKVQEKDSQFHHMLWVTTHSCEGLYVSDTKIDETKAFKGTFLWDIQKKFLTCIFFKEETRNPIGIVKKDTVGVYCIVKINKICTDGGKVIASAQFFIKKIVGSTSFKITNDLEGKKVKIRYIQHSYENQWVAEETMI